ncbi:hypothetical protein HK098_008032 [Nowakowskiella sp. JEL0407]|nr:hypothetical protein HK098_008032 [Nowakowskiella sp. JEL0407]
MASNCNQIHLDTSFRNPVDLKSSILFSSFAAILSRFFTHPLDTIKTVSQNNSISNPSFSKVAKDIYFIHGAKSFYRGLPVTLLFSVPGLSIYLSSYDYLKFRLSSQNSLLQNFRFSPALVNENSTLVHAVAAGGAEALSGLFWTPMEVLKNKLQVATGGMGEYSKRNVTARSLAMHIYGREGVRGFFRGYFIGLAVFVPYTVIYFTTYEQLKLMAQRNQPANGAPPFYTYVSSSAMSGGLAACISNILDVVKTRVQVSDGRENASAIATISKILRNEGIRGFTKGMAARILFFVPSVTISMTIYETLKDFYGIGRSAPHSDNLT